jgi:hypothetical protein
VVHGKKSGAHHVKGKHISGEKKKMPAKSPVSPQHAPAPIMDRRGNHERRSSAERRTHGIPVAIERRTGERREKVSRRRQIDPTTCERDYTPDEIEFMGALDDYKRSSGRMFPTCSEVLEVIKGLGYEKRPKDETAPAPIPELPVVVTTLEPVVLS